MSDAEPPEDFLVAIDVSGSARFEIGIGFAFVAISAKKIFGSRLAGEITEARDVDSHRLDRTTECRLRIQRGKFSVATGAADVSREVMTKGATGIRETFGIFARCGIEQNARG